jgi:hypothetical protein
MFKELERNGKTTERHGYVRQRTVQGKGHLRKIHHLSKYEGHVCAIRMGDDKARRY